MGTGSYRVFWCRESRSRDRVTRFGARAVRIHQELTHLLPLFTLALASSRDASPLTEENMRSIVTVGNASWEAPVICYGDAMAVSQDLTTAVCGGFNSLYFLLYALREPEALRRRVGAAALALVNGGALVESLYLLGLYLSLRSGWRGQTELITPGPWLLARALPFLGTLLVSLLILRRLARS